MTSLLALLVGLLVGLLGFVGCWRSVALLRGGRLCRLRHHRLTTDAQRATLFEQYAVHAVRRAAEFVDQVVLVLVVLSEPLFASTAELVEVLVLHGVAQADLERALGLLLLRFGRFVQAGVVGLANFHVAAERIRNRCSAEL